MKQNTLYLIVGILAVAILAMWMYKMKYSEGFDPSTRMMGSGIAGPNYGFDPIQDYADQIAAAKARGEMFESFEHSSEKSCNSCKTTEEFERDM